MDTFFWEFEYFFFSTYRFPQLLTQTMPADCKVILYACTMDRDKSAQSIQDLKTGFLDVRTLQIVHMAFQKIIHYKTIKVTFEKSLSEKKIITSYPQNMDKTCYIWNMSVPYLIHP